MRRLCLAVLLCLIVTNVAFGKTFHEMAGNVTVGPVKETSSVMLNCITWGGEAATIWMNGDLKTTPDSIAAKMGLNFELKLQDDPVQQVRDYMEGKTPYLRSTFRMGYFPSELLNSDPSTAPVCIMQLTWSAGDHMVGSSKIKTANDLNGCRVAMQRGGPHPGMVFDTLKAAGLTWSNITPVWCKNLSGEDSPAEKFRNGEADVACTITPDMIGLCSGLKEVGSGSEGTVKGSHVVNSTAFMSRSIADMYFVRSDYHKAHPDKVEKFVTAYLKATEELLAAQKKYDNGKGQSPKYYVCLEKLQSFVGKEVCPTIEEDTHGLVLDAKFVRIPGNESFFNDPKNPVGFESKQTDAIELAVQLGYCEERTGFKKARWDYKKISQVCGVKYVPPVMKMGRIKAEVTDFAADLDDNTILSFVVYFDPEQVTFPMESYGVEFKKVLDNNVLFGNTITLVRGHSDPTLALQHFFWAAKAKGLLTGVRGNYSFQGQPLGNLTNTQAILNSIANINLAGQKRQDRQGNLIEIPDPRQTVIAALKLSRTRAENVKVSLGEFAKKAGKPIDLTQIQVQEVGIKEPVIPRPRSLIEAKKNMRVEFRIIRAPAEAVSEDDFNFDQ